MIILLNRIFKNTKIYCLCILILQGVFAYEITLSSLIYATEAAEQQPETKPRGTPAPLPAADPFVSALYDKIQEKVKERITPHNIESLMTYLAFEADNLGVNDCIFTAFINLHLLKDLQQPEKAATASELLSKIAYMTILFNEEEHLPVHKENGRMLIPEFKKTVLDEMVKYFNQLRLNDSKLIVKVVEQGSKQSIVYTLDGKEIQGSAIILEHLSNIFPVCLIERSKNQRSFKYHVFKLCPNASTQPIAEATMALDGNNFSSDSRVTLHTEDPCLVILTNIIDKHAFPFAFITTRNSGTESRNPAVEERDENHFVVTSIKTLLAKNVYYSTKKGLTLEHDFASLFKIEMAVLYKLIKVNYEKLSKLTSLAKKPAMKESDITAFCIHAMK
ncbi:MAG TPA: hypothetical protein DIC42_02340 [Holosporales bacterium]|nr:hypothetical protein [Holosporales bacterium]